MTLFQRIGKLLFALLMIVFVLLLNLLPYDTAFMWIILILMVGLLFKGIKDIVFYFLMARHMVGGKMILLQGVLILDFAMFTGTLSGVPRFYAMLYLIGAHAFTGVVEVLRAIEAKSTVEGSWVPKLLHGVINILLALLCVIFSTDSGTAVTIFSISLIYSALMQMISAFRRTAFVLIE